MQQQQQTVSGRELYDLYMPPTLTFEQVAHIEKEQLISIMIGDFNIRSEKAEWLAVWVLGYATVQWLEQLEAEELENDILKRMEDEEAYYDADELYALAHPGALM